MASAYISQCKYYKLGEFVTNVGLGRRCSNAGGVRVFLDMVAAGFWPYITTFNLRVMAFTKICMFWDLHLTADHMRPDGVTPDLVTQ
uniref:Uncharacterized protein n=1 Tax=Oryza punctata TaxID=4537 RepID=A0A0E0LU52_ORYPU